MWGLTGKVLETFKKNQHEYNKRRMQDLVLRDLLESNPGKLDVSADAEPPLVWDRDLNFIGHKILEEARENDLDKS